MHGAPEIPLADAALRLGMSWSRAWRLVLTGELVGRKDGARWMVTQASVDRVRDERDAARGTRAVASA